MHTIAALLLLALAPQTPAPPKQSVQQLIAQMSSPDLNTRSDAFERLNAIPHIFERDDAAKAALSLLVTEDRI
ncbi:MAG TPA: hypothetical protein VN515_07685 [Terriglobales bacterium]|nr:hypothetical protein [Terriglobales bacterium]